MKFQLILIIFLSLAPFTPLAAIEPNDITYMTEDYPPENFLENGELKGYCVDILKAVWKNMGVPEQPVQVLPWARGYAMVQTEPNHMLFAMARNSERENKFKWVGPIYKASYKLFSLEDKNLQIKNIDDAKKFKIGVIRNDIGETLLTQAGFPDRSLTKVNSLTQLIKMLKADRFDMICSTDASLKNEINRDNSINLKHKTAWLVEDIQVYYAFSKSTDDDIVARFQKSLNSINEERKAIILKYNLSE